MIGGGSMGGGVTGGDGGQKKPSQAALYGQWLVPYAHAALIICLLHALIEIVFLNMLVIPRVVIWLTSHLCRS